MQYWRVQSLIDTPKIPRQSIIGLGFFDGFHRGHQALLTQAKSFKKPVMMLTFDRNPKWNRSAFLLTPPALRQSLFEASRVDGLIEIEFNDGIRLAPPQAFIEFLNSLNPFAVISGSDFKFGHQAQGDVSLLKHQALFEVVTVSDVMVGQEKISSSRILQLLEQGNIQQANHLLGRSYRIQGTVGHGFKQGRTIGFPTANIMISEPYALPKTGVYATEIRIGDRLYASMANLGFHPTLNPLTQKTLEVHIFQFDQSIYDQHVEVRFLEFLRDERKFESLDALKQQLQQDARTALTVYQTLSRTK